MQERVVHCDALTLSPNRKLLADLLMQRLLKAIAEPICVPGINAAVAATKGVALNPHDAFELRQADMAMYAAKAAGKNRYQLSTWGGFTGVEHVASFRGCFMGHHCRNIVPGMRTFAGARCV